MSEIFITPNSDKINIISIESVDGISFLRILDLKYEEPRFVCLVNHSIEEKHLLKTIKALNKNLVFSTENMQRFINTLDVISKTSKLKNIPVIRVNKVSIVVGVHTDSNNNKTILLEFFKSEKDLNKNKNFYSLQLTEEMMSRFIKEIEKLLYN